MVFAAPMIMQSLGAYATQEPLKEHYGIQNKIEHLGSKLTRDLRQNKENLSSVEVTVSGMGQKEQPSLISRSQAYNPATEFFRIGLNFEATSVSKVGRTTSTPPDTNGAIGPEQYIYVLNQEIKSFDRKTGLPDGVINSQMTYFFGVTGISDPHILYDHFAKAWYITLMSRDAGPAGLDVLLAVCKDCVITDCSQWDLYRIPGGFLAPGYNIPRIDYPLMSFDTDAVYVDINILDPTASFFLGVSIMVFLKETLLKGDPLVTIFPLVNPNPSDSSDVPIHVLPMINFDPHPEYAYFIHRSLSFGSFIYTNLHLVRIMNPGSSQPVLLAPVAVPVPPYSTFSGNLSLPVAGNLFPLGNNQLDVGAPGTCGVVRHDQLYAAFGGFADATGGASLNPDRFGILWYQLDLTGDSTGCGRGVETPSTVPATIQAGLIYDNSLVNPKSYFVGAIAENKLGDVVITGTESGPVNYTNVFYGARKKKDPLSTLRNLVLVTDNTSTPFNFGPFSSVGAGQRWGDYSSNFVDPCNDVNFWISGMFAGVQNGWSIQATELIRTNK
jgi:hypothetical protein